MFGAWIQDRIEKFGFKEGRDFEVISESGNNPEGGRPTKDYALTVAMAKELAMVENNDKGREIRQYLIQVEEAWNSPELIVARALQVAGRE